MLTSPMYHVGQPGTYGWGGITIWIIIAIVVLTATWVIELWSLSPLCGLLAASIFTLNILHAGVRH